MKKNNVLSVVREKKQRSERSQRFHFISSEVTQCSESSQTFYFNNSKRKTA